MENKKKLFFTLTPIVISPAIIFPIITNVWRYIYSNQASEFYGIPSEYFWEDFRGDLMLANNIITFVVFVLPIVIIFSPFLAKLYFNQEQLDKKTSAAYSFMLAFIFPTVFTGVLTQVELLMNFIPGFNYKVCAMIIFYIVFYGISFYIYYTLFTTNSDKIKKTKIFKWGFYVPVIISIFVIVSSFYYTINFKSANIKNYEIVNFDRQNLGNGQAIVSYKNGEAILMPCEIKNDKGKLEMKIEKGKYSLQEIKDKDINYIQFDEVKVK